jgi:hypothetical protein
MICYKAYNVIPIITISTVTLRYGTTIKKKPHWTKQKLKYEQQGPVQKKNGGHPMCSWRLSSSCVLNIREHLIFH